MSDADERFLAALAPELSALLGPRLDLLGLELERPGDGRVRITALIGTSAGTERIVEGREELKSVMEHLQYLPDDRRDALIMRFALGMDNREIARALGRSDGATKVLIHRAIKQLEEGMSADGS